MLESKRGRYKPEQGELPQAQGKTLMQPDSLSSRSMVAHRSPPPAQPAQNQRDDHEIDLEGQPLLSPGELAKEGTRARRKGSISSLNGLNSSAHTLQVLGVDLTNLPPLAQFAVLTAGVFGFFVICGSLEEYLFREIKGFSFGWYMTTWELIGFAILAVIESWFSGRNPFEYRAPREQHMIVAVSMTLARGLTNMSLQYLNFPTQVIFKSLKLIAVLIGSVLLNKKSYPITEYLSSMLLVLSAILFTLGDVQVSPTYSNRGLLIVISSLFFDAVHSNTQEKALQTHKAHMLEVMVYANIYGAGLCFLVVLLTGEFTEAWAFCAKQPIIYLYFLARLIIVYAGVLCFVATIKRFGVVLATTVTTIRKVLSIVLSFLMFPKPFHYTYVIAGAAFCAGTALNVLARKPRKKSSSSKST